MLHPRDLPALTPLPSCRHLLPAMVLPFLVLAACNKAPEETAAGGSPAGDQTVHAAYVLLSEGSSGPLAQARVIVDQGAVGCPILTDGTTTLTMSRRPQKPSGTGFAAIEVCEAEIPFGSSFTISWTGAPLPVAKQNPSRVVIFGDTGCKESTCGAALATPFDELAGQEAAKLDPAPDLVLHVGDYNYRGTSSHVHDGDQDLSVYDAGDDAPSDPQCQLDSPYVSQNAGYSDDPDGWEDWQLDFFGPAAKLLAAAPWVVARGNHELCSRAGPGWFYLLDPGFGSGQISCPPQGGESPPTDGAWPHILFPEPYLVDLGTLRVAVLDSANACDAFAPSALRTEYETQLGTLLGKITADSRRTWLLSHRPLWGVDGGGSTGGWNTLNATLEQALDGVLSQSGNGLPSNLELAVAGHMHIFETLTFGTATPQARPPQLIAGNGGIDLYSDLCSDETPCPRTFAPTVDGGSASGLVIEHHGFLVLDLDPSGSGYSGQMIGKGSTVYADCASANLPGSVCTEPGG